MLSKLQAIHSELTQAIATLAGIVTAREADIVALSAARLKLSRTSGRRRFLIECEICPLLHDVAPDDARNLSNLRRENAHLLVQSSEHIGRWTMRAIAADWPGYQRASAQIRARMLKRIAEEAAILYPLLKQHEAKKAA